MFGKDRFRCFCCGNIINNFFTFLKLSDYFSKKAIHEKLNYYLNKDKYTEVFFNKQFYFNFLEEKIILLLIEKSDVNFFAKLEDKTILIKVINHGNEISYIKIKNYSKFFSCFIFEQNN